jgi:hypothetical protein
MDRAERSSRSVRLGAQADRLAVDLILDCERAANRSDPRICESEALEPDRMAALSLAAAHAPSLVDLQRAFGR